MPEIKKYLNRDGLEDYNSLLPHSAGAMQEYVDAWLDNHPEATTTVQDGAVTTQKLAAKSVTRGKLADDVTNLLNGMMITGEVQGETLNAYDAYSTEPLSFTINGKSTQNGTPTPQNPVQIQSIEVLELKLIFTGGNLTNSNANDWQQGTINSNGTDATATQALRTIEYIQLKDDGVYTFATSDSWIPAVIALYTETGTFTRRITNTIEGEPVTVNIASYEKLARLVVAKSNTTVMSSDITQAQPIFVYGETISTIATIPMQGYVARSLPYGAKDTIDFEYLRPSTQQGKAVYSATLTQYINRINLGTLVWHSSSNKFYCNTVSNMVMFDTSNIIACMCDSYDAKGTASIGATLDDGCIRIRRSYRQFIISDSRATTAAELTTLLDNVYALYPLAQPIIYDLGEIELPELPAPSFTITSDPLTGLKMSYMRNASIVISDIEQTIADL